MRNGGGGSKKEENEMRKLTNDTDNERLSLETVQDLSLGEIMLFKKGYSLPLFLYFRLFNTIDS